MSSGSRFLIVSTAILVVALLLGSCSVMCPGDEHRDGGCNLFEGIKL